MPRLAFERSLPRHMRVTVLTDDVCVEGLAHEWGLSLHVCMEDPLGVNPARDSLLDFGQTDAFVRNAHALGVSIADVDHVVLSHAHYDHANGLEVLRDEFAGRVVALRPGLVIEL